LNTTPNLRTAQPRCITPAQTSPKAGSCTACSRNSTYLRAQWSKGEARIIMEKTCSCAHRAGQLFCSCANRQQIHLHKLLSDKQCKIQLLEEEQSQNETRKAQKERFDLNVYCELFIKATDSHSQCISMTSVGVITTICSTSLCNTVEQGGAFPFCFSAAELFYIPKKCLLRTGCTLMMAEGILMNFHCGTP